MTKIFQFFNARNLLRARAVFLSLDKLFLIVWVSLTVAMFFVFGLKIAFIYLLLVFLSVHSFLAVMILKHVMKPTSVSSLSDFLDGVIGGLFFFTVLFLIYYFIPTFDINNLILLAGSHELSNGLKRSSRESKDINNIRVFSEELHVTIGFAISFIVTIMLLFFV